jgi:ubiquitin C-terminal hydrolase
MLKETYSKEYSEIMDLFYGVYISEIVSFEGDNCLSMKPEPFFILDLPVWDISVSKPVAKLEECFELYCKPEYLEGDNAWYNEETKHKENVKKQITFWNFPKVLVIVLKRFSPDGQEKLNSMLEMPIDNLDLSKYVRGYNPQSYKYDLYGICNHIGGVLGGHYTAFVRNSENQWLHYNDSNVEIVPPGTSVVTPAAYCLFYRKKNNLV